MMTTLEFREEGSTTRTMQLAANTLTIAGWTGRNPMAVQHHIDELAAIGIAPPEQTPTLYRVASALLTTAPVIETVGDSSSGEVEFCLFNLDGQLYVTVGSDHTDRALERHDIALSKQVCAKPVSHACWRLDEVESHWDQLMLRSFATTDGIERLYQEGAASELLHPRTLLSKIEAPFDHGHVLFGGTVPVKGAVGAADCFRAELHDPVLGRTLACTYRTKVL
ncbi:DUF2848 domain-containing protein [Ralstonia pseudosolanacearum]|uniref:DUF2848 domain-containing protein n=1 Tax=Ralstonia pseudosolanacearum TaxID=1310165 RepID=UPI001E42320F|nr:DUF2848 domain-containing protein [Ralstonia pseudosolanacearum]